jgi:AAHS family benzoate transporter-like MFS transporter
VYAATPTVYGPAERATGLGWVTGVGRTGAVVGPWLGGAVVAGGNASLGFTTFAVAAVLGAVAISLVPLVRGNGSDPGTVRALPRVLGHREGKILPKH